MSRGRMLRRFCRSLQRRGVRGTVRTMGTNLDHLVLRSVGAGRERHFDRQAGVLTRGRRDLPADLSEHEAYMHAVHYQPTPQRRFRQLMQALPIARDKFVFIDLGCGMGKALLLASELGFGRVIGVEFDPELARAAQANCRSFLSRQPMSANATEVEVVCGDAAEYRFPPEPTVVYCFNPFDGVIMRRVAANLDASLEAHHRQLFFVYLHARHVEALREQRHLRPALNVAPELVAPPPARGLAARLRHEIGEDLRVVIYEATIPHHGVAGTDP